MHEHRLSCFLLILGFLFGFSLVLVCRLGWLVGVSFDNSSYQMACTHDSHKGINSLERGPMPSHTQKPDSSRRIYLDTQGNARSRSR